MNQRRKQGRRWPVWTAWAAVATLAMAHLALAIQPAGWTHSTEADFEPGETEGTVVTNLGDVKLAMETELIGEVPEEASIIYDVQAQGGGLFLAAGPEARLLGYRDGEITEHLALKNEQIFALDITADGRLLLGISGEPSRLTVLTPDGFEDLIKLDDVRYIWDIVVEGTRIYLATGTEGRLLMVDLADEGELVAVELLDATQSNLICLGRDERGNLYAGSDTDGLVYRIRPKFDAIEAWKRDRPAQPAEEDEPAANGEAEDAEVEMEVEQPAADNGDEQDALVLEEAAAEADDAAEDEEEDEDKPVLAETFVLYDAPEPEIGALLVLANGTVFAGTADAEQARPGRLEEAASEEAGRLIEPGEIPPEAPPEVPIEPQPEEPPDPGDLPQVPPDPEPAGEQRIPEIEADGDDEVTIEERVIVVPESGRRRFADEAQTQPALPAEKGADAAAETDAAPTPEQRDRLRAVIRERLERARRSGVLQTPAVRRGRAGRGMPMQTARPQVGGGGGGEGNAVYRIGADGFVSEVFRESVMILKLVLDPLDDDRLLVATGNEGQLFRVDLQAEETTILTDLEPQQIPALAAIPGRDLGLEGDGPTVILATANPASLVQLGQGFAAEGTYTGPVLDAQQISLWGALNLTGQIPADTALTVQTRSGNVQDPDQAAWSPWSEAASIEHDPDAAPLAPRELRVDSPPARFLQYRLTLTGNGAATPAVGRVRIAYVMPNLKPRIAAVRVGNPFEQEGAQPNAPMPGGAADDTARVTTRTIEWEAADPNNDPLSYTLEYRPAGAEKWLPIAENVSEASYEWQTLRVPDGRYIVRVVASDAAANTPDMALAARRQSDPVLVDNTPPQLQNVQARVANGQVRLSGEVVDALSPIRQIQYTIDSEELWQAVLPEDLIFDSTTEQFAATIPDLSPGQHVVTLRASDAQANTVYQAVIVEVE